MHRFTIKRKISDTLLGATYECELRVDKAPDSTPATHSQRRSTVAIKCSSLRRRQEITDTDPSSSSSTDTETSLFALDDPLRERRVVAKLIASGGHSNVLQCYDHFISDNASDASEQPTDNDHCVYIVTEFCSGGDLFERLGASPTGTIDRYEALKLITQVSHGLAFLHSLGFAHRDLSLENVLLRGGTCKVADFGAATDISERCCDRVGKQQYMAPEVALADANNTYDPRQADVWSLGVMLFMLLTGSPLVSVASEEDPRFVVLQKHGINAILEVWGMIEEQVVSTEVVSLLEAMLHVDPNRRIRVPELVKKLESILVMLERRELCDL